VHYKLHRLFLSKLINIVTFATKKVSKFSIMTKFTPLLAIIVATIVSACYPGRIYNEWVSMGSQMVWDMNNIIEFDPQIADTSERYNINIGLRTVDYYPNSNMWLYIRTVAPSGAERIDTMECVLRDEKGFSNSNSTNFGELEDYDFVFKSNVKFAELGQYKFFLQHGMRAEKLPYVNEVGLNIEKVK